MYLAKGAVDNPLTAGGQYGLALSGGSYADAGTIASWLHGSAAGDSPPAERLQACRESKRRCTSCRVAGSALAVRRSDPERWQSGYSGHSTSTSRPPTANSPSVAAESSPLDVGRNIQARTNRPTACIPIHCGYRSLEPSLQRAKQPASRPTGAAVPPHCATDRGNTECARGAIAHYSR